MSRELAGREPADTGGALVTIAGLSIGVGAKRAVRPLVHNVSFSLWRNEILCLVGESGSGKSLTARSTIRLFSSKALRVTSGRIEFDGEDLTKVSPSRMREIRGSRIAMIFQEPMTALNPLMRVGRQVEEVLDIHASMSRPARQARVLELFEEVRLPDPARAYRAYPHELSGGQRQRVMIAMALCLEPDILLADEPTTALDVTTQRQILRLMKELQSRHGTGIIFITHDFGVVSEIADRVAVMEKGRLVEMGTMTEVMNRPRHPYTKKLIAAIPAPKVLSPGPENSEIIMSARRISKSYPARGGRFGKPAQRTTVLHDVSFDIHRGETFGIVGESGSGKTTIGRILTGLLPADSGEVAFRDRPLVLSDRASERSFRRSVQIIFQDPFGSLNPRRRIGDLVASGPIAMGATRDRGWKIACEKLALVDLPPNAVDSFPHEFSGGQRQRIAIARALAVEPALIVADEATSALDVSVQAQILDLLRDLKSRLSLTLVFITHDLRVAAGICDSIAVMQNGRVVEQGSAAEVFGSPRAPYTRRLLAAIPGQQAFLQASDLQHVETDEFEGELK